MFCFIFCLDPKKRKSGNEEEGVEKKAEKIEVKKKDLKKTKLNEELEDANKKESAKPQATKMDDEGEEHYYGKDESVNKLIPNATNVKPTVNMMTHPAEDETSMRMEQLAVSCATETNRKSLKENMKEIDVKPVEPVKKTKSSEPVVKKSDTQMDIQDEGDREEPEVMRVRKVRKILKDRSYVDAKGYLGIINLLKFSLHKL